VNTTDTELEQALRDSRDILDELDPVPADLADNSIQAMRNEEAN
jgi:hypothetical protein